MRSRPFFAARIEDRLNHLVIRVLLRLGWQESVVAYTGFGTPQQVRILARVILRPPSQLGIVQVANELAVPEGLAELPCGPVGGGARDDRGR